MPASRTFSPRDFQEPEVAGAARELRRFAFRLGARGTRFAVNGILRWRFVVRRHKLWEYARGVACLEQAGARRVLDFGGGATLPVFFLADRGCDVFCLDVDAALADWTNRVAAQPGWRLRASTFDLTENAAPAEWGQFDAVISFSVLEHLPPEKQALAMSRLAARVAPGGVMAVTFDFGADAPVANALRDVASVERLVAATGLEYLDGQPFADTGERFTLDRRHPSHRFTFGSLFLRRPPA